MRARRKTARLGPLYSNFKISTRYNGAVLGLRLERRPRKQMIIGKIKSPLYFNQVGGVFDSERVYPIARARKN